MQILYISHYPRRNTKSHTRMRLQSEMFLTEICQKQCQADRSKLTAEPGPGR